MSLNFKKRIFNVCLWSFFLIMLDTPSFAFDLTFTWDGNPSSNVDHFVVYWGKSTKSYTNNSTDIAKNGTTFTVNGLLDGQVYYFAMKAFDSQGRSSDFSNEVSSGVVINNPVADFTVALQDYTSYTVSGFTEASANVEVLVGGSVSVGSTIADTDGKWEVIADFTPILEGIIILTATTGVYTSVAVSGEYDKTPPAKPTSVSVQSSP